MRAPRFYLPIVAIALSTSGILGASVIGLASFVLPTATEAQNAFSLPARITLRIHDKRGNIVEELPTVKLYEEGGGVYSSTPGQATEGWYFDIRSPGNYTVEVSLPGYKRVQRVATIKSPGENYQMDLTLEPEGNSAKTASPSNEEVLAPKALEEKKKGIQALKDKNLSEAKKHFDKALQLAPGSSELNYWMGVLSLKTNNLPTSVQYLEKSVSLDPKYFPALFSLGEVQYKQGHYPQAVDSLEHGLALKPDAWLEEWLLSSALYEEEKYEQAKQHAQLALSIGKEEAGSVEFLLGKCEASLGEKKEAIAALQSFLAKQPGAPEAAEAQQILKQLQQASP